MLSNSDEVIELHRANPRAPLAVDGYAHAHDAAAVVDQFRVSDCRLSVGVVRPQAPCSTVLGQSNPCADTDFLSSHRARLLMKGSLTGLDTGYADGRRDVTPRFYLVGIAESNSPSYATAGVRPPHRFPRKYPVPLISVSFHAAESHVRIAQ